MDKRKEIPEEFRFVVKAYQTMTKHRQKEDKTLPEIFKAFKDS